MGRMETTHPVIALVRDLLLASRITTAARSSGGNVQLVRSPGDLAGLPGSLLLADLNLEGAIEAAAAWRQARGGAVVGFVSHADAATIAAARQAGINRVMARSAFFESLPDLLKGAAD